MKTNHFWDVFNLKLYGIKPHILIVWIIPALHSFCLFAHLSDTYSVAISMRVKLLLAYPPDVCWTQGLLLHTHLRFGMQRNGRVHHSSTSVFFHFFISAPTNSPASALLFLLHTYWSSLVFLLIFSFPSVMFLHSEIILAFDYLLTLGL